MTDATPQGVAAAIEDLFERQPDEHEMLEWLEELQELLVGAEVVDQMRADRLAALEKRRADPDYRLARLLTPAEITKDTLAILQRSIVSAKRLP